MILTRQQANAIATGRKTTHHTLHDTLRTGSRIPIQVRTRPRQTDIVCHAQITATEQRPLRDLTRTEAKREGFDGPRGPLHWRKAWLQQHDGAWFSRQELSDTGLTDTAAQDRFQVKHAGQPVTVLTLQIAEEPDRWMAPSAGKQTKHQTTSNPRQAIDELAVPPQEYVDMLANRANENRTAKQAQARKEAALESFAIALHKARGKQANNMVRAAERMARLANTPVDGDTA